MPQGLEDSFAGLLWTAGSLGQELVPLADGRVEVIASFESDAQVFSLPLDWSRRGVEWLGEEPVAERDWQEEFRRHALPFRVGRRLIIDPGERDGGLLLRLPARNAFGTGTHESTRLALELLEDLDLASREVLDVGTGTGVLALAALLFGAARAVAFDIDLAAAFAARDNARRNAVAGCLVFAGPLEALRASRAFDVALLNVVPEEAGPLLRGVVMRLRHGGEAVVSGFLAAQAGVWEDELRGAGLERTAAAVAGEWTAFCARRP